MIRNFKWSLARLKGGLPNTLAFTSLVSIAGLCSGITLAQTLGPALRGEFVTILLWPFVLGTFGELGLGLSMAYFAAKDPRVVGWLWITAWGVSIVWGGSLVFIALVLLPAVLPISPDAMTYLRQALFTVPVSLAIGYQASLLLGTNNLACYNIVRGYTALSYSGGVVAVALLGSATLSSYTAVYLLSQGTGCILVTYLVLTRIRPSPYWQPRLFRGFFVYGIKSYVSSIAAQANLRLDQLLMTAMAKPAELGLYVVAVAVSGLLAPLYSALAIVVLPRVLHAADKKTGGKQAARHFQLGVLIGVPLAAIAMVLVSWTLPILFGSGFAGAVILAQILLVAAIFQGLIIVLGNSLRGLGQPGKTALAEGLGLAITGGLLLLLLPVLGALGAALASLAAYSLVCIVQLFFVCRVLGLSIRGFLILDIRSGLLSRRIVPSPET